MKSALLSFSLLTLGFAAAARGNTVFYDNTTIGSFTGDTFFYSVGPYVALGDQIHLLSAATVDQAKVEMFNNGAAGTFDAELDFYDLGTPVGALIGSFDMTGIVSTGSDVIDLTFTLGAGLAVPQDLVFTMSVSNLSPNMDLGLDMFEPPTVGSSDNSFMIAATSGPTYFHLGTPSENVYFQLSEEDVPEPSSVALLGAGLLIAGIGARLRRKLNKVRVD
jgi:PEP-CTERM motif